MHNNILSGTEKFIKNLSFNRYVLSISHSNFLFASAGTERVQYEEQAALKDRGISYIQIYPEIPFSNNQDRYMEQVFGVNIDSIPTGFFTLSEVGAILQLISGWEKAVILAVHIHHLMNLSISGVHYLVSILKSPKIRIFIHDFFTICPNYKLLKNNRHFCEAPPIESNQCRQCEWGDQRQIHFHLINRLFTSFDAEFIAPSNVAANIWRRCFPEYDNRLRVIPHQVEMMNAECGMMKKNVHHSSFIIHHSPFTLRLAFLGHEVAHKGKEVWRHIASEPDIKNRYDLFHFGTCANPIAGVNYIAVSFLRDGSNAMIDALKAHQINIAFLWSICRETYSFTLFEALAANCFIITNRHSGNIAAQIKGTTRGIVFDSAFDMIRFLKDTESVKKAVLQNLNENPERNFVFNTALADETASDIHHSSFIIHNSSDEPCHFFTSITANYLPKARVLAKTLKKHHPAVVFHLALCDKMPDGIDINQEPFDYLIQIQDLNIPDTEAWIFKHRLVELCTAVKASAFFKIFEKASHVIYLDPDIVVLNRLDNLMRIFDNASVILTPHILEPESDDMAVIDNEICTLQHGIYNLGFIGIKKSEAGLKFLNWWQKRLLTYCYDDIPSGLFTDQRWVDLALAFFDDIHILKDRTYNVATWNLTHRSVYADENGILKIEGSPVKFFHFSGFDSGAQEGMLKKYAGDNTVLFNLRAWYIKELEKEGQQKFGTMPCSYSFYSNGEPIEDSHRKIYRSRRDLIAAFPNPDVVIDGFCYRKWLKEYEVKS